MPCAMRISEAKQCMQNYCVKANLEEDAMELRP